MWIESKKLAVLMAVLETWHACLFNDYILLNTEHDIKTNADILYTWMHQTLLSLCK